MPSTIGAAVLRRCLSANKLRSVSAGPRVQRQAGHPLPPHRPAEGWQPVAARPQLPRCMAASPQAESSAAAGNGDGAADAAVQLVLVVAAVLLNEEGHVLLAQRPPGKKLAGLWEFPGGKVDRGESPEAALVRECEEELGIRLDAAALRPLTFASHAYPSFHLLMPTYVASRWQGQPRGAEGQQLAWVAAEELEAGRYEMPPADVPLLPPVLEAMRRHRQATAAARAAAPDAPSPA